MINDESHRCAAHGNAHNGTYVMVQDLGGEIGFEEFLLLVAKDEEPQSQGKPKPFVADGLPLVRTRSATAKE